MLNDKMLKPSDKTDLKYKYQLKQKTKNREKNVATDKRIIWKIMNSYVFYIYEWILWS